MADQDKIINLIRLKGPSIPRQIAQAIGSDLLFSSAHLSDLVSQGKLVVSHMKLDSTPFYYIPGQEAMLCNFLNCLNEKDRRTAEMLKEKGVLRDRGSDLLTRVSLRNLPDFAKPMEVEVNGQKEYFFRWHTLQHEETEKLLKKEMGIVEPPAPIPIKEPLSEIKPITKEEPKIISPELKVEVKLERPKEEKLKTEEQLKSEEKTEEKHRLEKRTKAEEEQKTLQKETATIEKKKVHKKTEGAEGDFLALLLNFFDENKIKALEQQILRKNAEMNFTLSLPTPVGEVKYYCKAKNKKRCDEKDLSAAILEAQMKKLPLLFLHSGELSKKAGELLKSPEFNNISVKNI